MTRANLTTANYGLLQSAKDRINSIFLGRETPLEHFDWRAASQEILMSRGCVALEMEVPYLQYGSLVVSQIAAGRLRSDCGTVLSVGGPRKVGKRIVDPSLELYPGDRVATLPYDGKYFSTFRWGSYSSYRRWIPLEARFEQSRVRMLGVASLNEFEHLYKDWWEVILAKIQTTLKLGTVVTVNSPGHAKHGSTGLVEFVDAISVRVRFLHEDEPEPVQFLHANELEIHQVQPLNKWVLIRRLPVHRTSGMVHLPDSQAYREQVAQVMSIGPRVETYRQSDFVIYQGKALLIDFEFGERFGFQGNPRDYVMIHEDDIHARLRPPEPQ